MNTKEVYYSEYCVTCKHRAVPGFEDPCNECLNQPWNEDSHKPVKYEKVKDKANA